MKQGTDRRFKIAFLTSESAHDRHGHSGSLYYMGKALEQFCGEVTYIEQVVSWERRVLGRVMREAAKRHFKWHIAYKRLLSVARAQAKLAAQHVASQQFDLIVAPDCVSEIAFLQTDIPILLTLDITFSLQRNYRHDYYHPEYSHLLPFSVRQGEIVERAAFQRASRLLFSSPWAARSAMEDYDIDPRKVYALFWGANIDHVPPREQVLLKKPSGRCRLLFIGTAWQRKGGDIAYETLLKLEELGIEAELIICGTMPPPGIAHRHLKVIPYLDKSSEQQEREIEKLYATADFLILPTRVDCVPNVFSEANAFGVPVITTHTGGVACAVRDGENGYVLPFEARGEAFATVIADLYGDEQRYLRLVQSSRVAYDERLNWDIWAKAVHALMQEVVV